MKLPLVTSDNKGKAILIGYLLFSCFYGLAPHIHLVPLRHIGASMVDACIPFIPSSVWIYDSQFLFLFLALWLCPDTTRRTMTYYAMLISTLIAFLFFIFLPTTLPRQTVDTHGITAWLWQMLYLTDTPQNCFPSLHVTLALLAANALVAVNLHWQKWAPLWATMICLATLTTKQHYLIDILGGIVVALGAWRMVNYVDIAEYGYENTHQ